MSKRVAVPRTDTSASRSSTRESKPRNHAADRALTVDALLPPGTWQRMAAGVAAAAGGGLLAAAAVGVGPAALAGAAGYLAYRGLHEAKKHESELPQHRS